MATTQTTEQAIQELAQVIVHSQAVASGEHICNEDCSFWSER